MTEPYRLTASAAGAMMQKGTLTVEDYAKSLLSRVAARDAVVKAWAYLNPEQVLAEARKLDQIPADKRGPLHGIAIGVKDVILTKDMPTSHNSPIYAEAPALGVDAACIITLRAAGALIMGKTTTTEFAAVSVGGPATNPHDPTRTPGGSSSGSGAAVGDFQVPIGLGTQTGGSTIRPGSFNGIYAMKPTWAAISREGLAQYSVTCDTLGLYGRCAEDLELLAKVFQLADDEPVPAAPFLLKGAKIAMCKSPAWTVVGPGTVAAMEKAKELLTESGAIVEELELPDDFTKIKNWHQNILAGEGRTSFLGQYLLAKDKLNDYIVDHVENVKKLSRKAQLDSYDNVARLRPVWDDIASKYDAIITPSSADVAPVGLGFTGDASFCSMWTVLQVPCVNVPGFAGASELPIGLTIVGPRYTDLHTIYTAKTIGPVFELKGGFESKLL